MCCGLCSQWNKDKEAKSFGVCNHKVGDDAKKLFTGSMDKCPLVDGEVWDCTGCHGIHELKTIGELNINIMELIMDEVKRWNEYNR